MSQSPAPGRRRILVAEDTESIAFMMLQILKDGGYDAVLARDGEECLAMVDALDPDLLLLDLMMPKVHGVEVMKRLRSREATRDLGVVVCTAKPFRTEYAAAADWGAVDFLVKPFTPRELLDVVNGFFQAKSDDGGQAERAEGPARSAIYRPDLETGRGNLTLWGTRGSIPTPGPAFLRHGGNTSCMSVELGDEVLVFDAGSGIRELGLDLVSRGPRRIHLFITHTHWDHIQGFPFFNPAYVPGFELVVWGAKGFGKSLDAVFKGQLDQDYFPVQMEDLQADIEFRHLDDDAVEIGDLTVTWEYAQHPGATVGYRIDVAGTSLSWFPDDEFLLGYRGRPEELEPGDERLEPYRKVLDFLTDVDILVHEAQYTNDEYPDKVGWGHSSVSNACLMAKLCNARRWIVTHHDPMHDDRFLETKLNLTRQQLARLDHPIPVSHGYDGMAEYL
jgi:phosphoribosyl 1,2-cyclic phosphodiesterase/ActR/RegA family two-component response regulator